jgi:methylated-DNA-[protein]-cysteine S-methyltransferase
MSFRERVYRAAEGIPRGRVISYSGLAELAGSPGAARAVGTLMAGNPRPGAGPGRVPCHRVVSADGSLGGFSAPGGLKTKKAMLEREGIVFRNGRIRRDFFL